ncbi:hypothetical protein [Rhodococcus koreensis]|uniref:Uncharacterized protein n=1 Tax=Rhodococcus koreensis TaxID=99653 RepID=A0A1H4XZB6_9NOCA|nr:hypothetical protein [Rhodococcus koreensis]SED10999.1 hypothetical protein SAMN04490239_6853 [Rhodococcus koreensis]
MSTLITSIAVGDRAVSDARRVSELALALPEASLTGIAVAGLLAPRPAVAATRTGLQWNSQSAVTDDDVVRVESVVTRVEQSADGAVLDRHVRLVDDGGSVREQGIETWRLPDPAGVRYDPAVDFCTPAWGEVLRESLSADPAFASSLATWDGTVGLRCTDASGGSREVHLRIYRGRIIDVARRVPGGATFTLVIPAVTWVDLMVAEHNDFMRRAISGEFSSSGDGYEYLRLTKPLDIVIAHARTAAREWQSVSGHTLPLTCGREAQS